MARKKGDGSWGKVTIHGVEYHCFKKRYPGMDSQKCFYGLSVTEVKKKVKSYETSINEHPPISSPKITFGEYIVDWLKKNKFGSIKKNTYQDYEDLISNYIVDFDKFDVGNKQLKQLNGTIFQNHINSLAESLSRSTIIKLYAIITPCLKSAYRQKHISSEIWDTYRIPIEENMVKKRKEPKFLTKEDVFKLLKEAKRVNPETGIRPGRAGEYVYGNNAFIIMLIVSTGLRIGEALALTWDDIDFNKNVISINKNLVYVKNEKADDDDTKKASAMKPTITSPKTKKSYRVIHMSDITIWAVSTLKEAQENQKRYSPSGEVCKNKIGNLVSIRNLRRTLNLMLVNGGCSIPKCGLHALRHSFGSILLSEGVDIKVISALLGHTNVSTTYNIYIHLIERQRIEAIDVFNFAAPE